MARAAPLCVHEQHVARDGTRRSNEVEVDEGRANTAEPAGEEDTLSVVTAGPLYRLMVRTGLSGAGLNHLGRRVVAAIVIVWLPIVVLALLQGRGDFALVTAFFLDVQAQVRLLVALPVLMGAELLAHPRMERVIRQFVERDIVPESSRAEYRSIITSARADVDSPRGELVLCVLVLVAGAATATSDLERTSTWSYLGGHRLTLAGLWHVCVSLPVFRFLLVRWYFRILVWTRFLSQVARLPLAVAPLHPDRSGGLGFLAPLPQAFAPLLFAHGVLLAAMMLDGVLAGRSVTTYLPEISVIAVIMPLVAAGPLVVFMLPLQRARRAALRRFGQFAIRYVRAFDARWLQDGGQPPAEMLGTPDVQSLADLANSFQVVQQMRVIPVSRTVLLSLVVVTLLPAAPLALTIVSLRQLLAHVVKLVF